MTTVVTHVGAVAPRSKTVSHVLMAAACLLAIVVLVVATDRYGIIQPQSPDASEYMVGP